MRWMRREAVLMVMLAFASPAYAQAVANPAPEQASQATIRKLNTYVSLLNRTLRASESIARYDSWVDMKSGPTGRERIIYGLYSLYDVRGELEKARAALALEPAMPELDGAIPAYMAAYEALAPTINQAEGYYERQDYKVDQMREGRALHAKLAPAAQAFLAERAKVDPLFAREKSRSDAVELALIEKREGRSARWHVGHVMIRAREVMALLPTEAKPVIDMGPFDQTLAEFAVAVRSLDEFGAAQPGALSSFESRPRSFLGKLREFRDKLAKAKGDARRGGGNDLTWIVSDYNSMVSMSQISMRSPR